MIAAMRAGLRSLAAGLIFTPAALAQTALLQPRFEAGQVARFDLRARFETFADNDPAVGEQLTQWITLRATVAEVDPLGGASVRIAFERFRIVYRAHGQETPIIYTWTDAPGDAPPRLDPAVLDPAPAPDPPGGGDTPAGRVVRSLAGRVLDATVRADGTVTSVVGLAQALEELEPEDVAEGVRALGVFAPGSAARSLELLWRIDPGPDPAPRAPGETWAYTDRVALPSGHDLDVRRRVRLESIDAGLAIASGESRTTLAPTSAEPDPAAPRPRITDQSGVVSVQWDLATGLALARVEERMIRFETSLDSGLHTAGVLAKSRLEVNRAPPRADPALPAPPDLPEPDQPADPAGGGDPSGPASAV